jgi:tetratricopeptide (TPR) repeat protein
MKQSQERLQSLLNMTIPLVSENSIPEAEKAWNQFFYDHLVKSSPGLQKTICNSLLKQLPGSYAGYYFRGCALMALNNYPDALSDFTKANNLKPGESRAIYKIAICLHKLNRTGEAIKTCQKLLKMKPPNPEYFQFTSEILISLSYYNDALKLLKNALKYDPGNIFCLIQKANCLRLMQDYKNAHEVFEKAEKMLQNSIDQEESLDHSINFYFFRSHLKSSMGDPEGSRKDYINANSILNQ